MPTLCYKCGHQIEMEFKTVFADRATTGKWLHSSGGSFDNHRAYPDWYTPQMRGEPTEKITARIV